MEDLIKERSGENNYDAYTRRIESVRAVEIVEIRTIQFEENKNGIRGFVTEYWTKEGIFLTRFKTPADLL